MLKEYGINVIAFCDNNEKKWGINIGEEQIPCIKPEEALTRKCPIVIATRNYAMPIVKQLEKYDVEFFTSDAFLFYKEIDKLEKVLFEILDNEISRNTYITLIEAMSTGDFSLINKIYCNEQYYAIPEFAMHRTDDVFVDCGASVGDTIEQFIYKRLGAFKKIYAFEPCQNPFHAMENRVTRLLSEWAIKKERIELNNMAVGNFEGNVFLDFEQSLGETFVLQEGEKSLQEVARVITLDSFFYQTEEKVTFIKADIEGYELQMLQGAQNLIVEQRPKLAICIYHLFRDLFTIPIYIKSLVPEYRMQIRHHGHNLWETVLYCYIEE